MVTIMLAFPRSFAGQVTSNLPATESGSITDYCASKPQFEATT